MAKVSGAYDTVVRGVSEQVPQDRRPGQHHEQINQISDPVRGNARRPGSVLQIEQAKTAYSAPVWAKWLADTRYHKTLPFQIGGVEYDISYRTKADTQALGSDTFAFAYNKTSKTPVPITMGSGTAALQAGGVSAIVSVGKYLFIAGNTVVPTYTGTDTWGATANRQKMAVQFRGGAYSRTFRVKLTKTDNTTIEKTYKTKSSSYPTALNTSDIPSTDPQYQGKIAERTAQYNSAVTLWIGEAAADQTPENLATQFAALFTADGVTGVTAVAGTLCIDNPLYKEVLAEDSGDGSLVRAVGGVINNVDLVSGVHWPGKVVKVRPKKASEEDALYLKAVPKDPAITGAFTEVTWMEGAGFEMQPTTVFAVGTIVGGTLYIGGTPAELASISGDATPGFSKNLVGDQVTAPLPYFMNRKIDYLGVFQDRLVIGSGATLFFSRPGDYFNWYRTTVLAIEPNDPLELAALNAEDDTIKFSTTYDRNLLLFGLNNQYTINGRQTMDPRQPPSIVVQSSYEDAVDAAPVNSGNFVFYADTHAEYASMHQIQLGAIADNPESYNVTNQLDHYIAGKPVEIVPLTNPNCIFLRTDGLRNRLYTFSYLDTATGAERLFDSWSRWEWDVDNVGAIIGMSRHEGDLLVHLVKQDGFNIWYSVERFALDTGLSTKPYADSLRPAAGPLANTGFIKTTSAAAAHSYIAFGSGTYRFLGTTLDRYAAFVEDYPTAPSEAWVGVHYDAMVTPTNPYMRDSQGKAIVNGRLTLTKVLIAVSDSGGLVVDLETARGTSRVADWVGRVLGRAADLVGRQPIVTSNVSAPIGREVRECKYTIRSKTFLPMTITAIEWVGQYFNNLRRVN
ncbi:tail tubular protein B [Caulobacter phage Percy]|uniref:Tail tubular protein B n=1 Tax=Caulobacter phage Percy TaxID=1701809 RepID=A0A0M4S5R2_9CAUD|nr:tail protein [Caulobacter phage Percy]ALF01675.1 tail tubular protein B [Caulobacter phage Percy]